MLSEDVVPFGIRSLKTVVCPILSKDKGHVILDSKESLKEGFPGLSDWLEKAEQDWERHRSNENMSLYQRINYSRLLEKQNPLDGHLVIYNGCGKNISSAVLDIKSLCNKEVNGLNSSGLIVDCKFFYINCKSLEEAYYLCSALNSKFVNDAIKPFQTKGNLGERDIHRRPFEYVDLPAYDAKNSQFTKLATLGRLCSDKVSALIEENLVIGVISRARSLVRSQISHELESIDLLVRGLLGKARRKSDRALRTELKVSDGTRIRTE